MSLQAKRLILACIGGAICGCFIPSLSGENRMMGWAILIAFSTVQTAFLHLVFLPDEEKQ